MLDQNQIAAETGDAGAGQRLGRAGQYGAVEEAGVGWISALLGIRPRPNYAVEPWKSYRLQ